MNNIKLSPTELLAYIPQQPPFRFVDKILSVDEHQITGTYTFKSDESFYAGHFPQQPITPGVILLEAMCQIGVVAHGFYLLSLETDQDHIKKYLSFFTDAKNVEFFNPVLPGQQVFIKAKNIYWRRKKISADIQMFDANNTLIATTIASGQGVMT